MEMVADGMVYVIYRGRGGGGGVEVIVDDLL